MGLVCRCHPGTQASFKKNVSSCRRSRNSGSSAARILPGSKVSFTHAGSAARPMMPICFAGPQGPITGTNQHEGSAGSACWENRIPKIWSRTVGRHHRVVFLFLRSAQTPEGVRLIGSQNSGVLHVAPGDGAQAAHRPESLPRAHSCWEGFRVQLWKPCRNSRKRRIAATTEARARRPSLL